MASRIGIFLSRTAYFTTVLILTVIGLTSIVIGFIGLGLYIPTSKNYQLYSKTICSILDHEYDNCEHGIYISPTTCFSIMWSVEYIISNSASDRYVYSTITQIYEKSIEALDKLASYQDNTNHTCYYHQINVTNVQWEEPPLATPYLIMLIVGFSFASVYIFVIGIIIIYRCRSRKE
ncbi:hypothetical protein I4U23_018272 [Adineta vaga]|nr:hypothetical protein I4U23_018272 [Adineta vaga]